MEMSNSIEQQPKKVHNMNQQFIVDFFEDNVKILPYLRKGNQ